MKMSFNPKSKSQNRKSFTLIELLVVVSIIAVLISILLPALTRARESSRQVYCQSNQRSIGLNVRFFASDHTDHPPTCYYEAGDISWYGMLKPYMGTYQEQDAPDDSNQVPGILVCPSIAYLAVKGFYCTYAYGRWADSPTQPLGLPFLTSDPRACSVSLDRITRPSDRPMVVDCLVWDRYTPGWGIPRYHHIWDYVHLDHRHLDTINLLMVDGHVEKKKDLEIPPPILPTKSIGLPLWWEFYSRYTKYQN
jgi:prepilin-type N-terminal cleavage/methylation domain-containing protein/prepilin-type processing-associated H-X9-DG protein